MNKPILSDRTWSRFIKCIR